jgi:hypothetical protein
MLFSLCEIYSVIYTSMLMVPNHFFNKIKRNVINLPTCGEIYIRPAFSVLNFVAIQDTALLQTCYSNKISELHKIYIF